MRLIGMLACCFWFAAHSVAANAPPLAAEPAKLAAKSLLLDLAAAGQRLVAVGERGHVLLSDDQGKSWTQAKHVPSQALLTGVCFFDAQHGIAVGHDETILTTSDSGNTWALTHYAPDKQQPLFDVWCGADRHAITVGAFSTFYESRDSGASWSLRAFAPKPRTAPANDDGLQSDFHLNRIVGASPSRLYIAAEAGHVYRSDDAGASWVELPSPYEGSFFGALALSENDILLLGLRGNLYRSSNAGESWQKVPTRTTAMLNDAVKLNGQHIAVVGLSGVVLFSKDNGHSFVTTEQADRKGFSAAWATGPRTLAAVGEDGARLLEERR